jgi:phosphoribosylformimino-5-aminoimidazole carboxamide ribotide isomerase
MLIPSIDLQRGRIVQLVQGETTAIESTDVRGWIRRFSTFPAVQLIDLDAAKSEGCNARLVRRISAQLPCRVGGGIRSIDRALEVLSGGARKVILGSAFFSADGVDIRFAEAVAAAVGPERLIAAVDTRGGYVAVHGWRQRLPVTPEAAMRLLEPFVGEFLYTNIDREGLMQGIDQDVISRVRGATTKALAVAGGVTTATEVEWLARQHIDAVVGMAIYSGVLQPDDSEPS